MKTSTYTPVAVALSLAAAATLAVFLYVSGLQGESGSKGSAGDVEVVISTEDIPSGTKLDDLIEAGAFTTASIPEEAVVAGAVTNLTQLKGKETSAAILAGEQISTARLLGSGELPGGSLGIPAGYVAVSIDLEGQRSVGGALRRSDHVTIYATVGRSAESASTIVLVPDAQVLKVSGAENEGLSSGPNAATTITFSLKPEEAQKLAFAHDEGQVRLALLPPGEEGSNRSPVTLGRLTR